MPVRGQGAARSAAAVAGAARLFQLRLLLLLLSLALPRAIASSSSCAFQVVAPSPSRPTAPPLPRGDARRRLPITVMQGQASLHSSQLLPSPPFVVYLTPGVPEAGGAAALEAWYRKVGRVGSGRS